MNGVDFRRLRLATGLSQAGFAAALGYTCQASSRTQIVYLWESGRRAVPNRTAILAQLVASRIVLDREAHQRPEAPAG